MSDSFIFYDSYYQAVAELPEEMQLEMLEVIIRYGLYGEEPGYNNPISRMIYELVRPTIDANQGRRVNGARGGRPKKPMVTESKTIGYESENHRFPNSKPNVNVNVNVNGNENVNVNENVNENVNDNVESAPQKPKRTRFVPPTLEEVAAYSIEKGLGLDCERFVDFYSAKGWKVGSSPMKDWKAAARNWARQDKERSQQKKPKRFNNFQEHSDTTGPSDLAMELFRRQQAFGKGGQ